MIGDKLYVILPVVYVISVKLLQEKICNYKVMYIFWKKAYIAKLILFFTNEQFPEIIGTYTYSLNL